MKAVAHTHQLIDLDLPKPVAAGRDVLVAVQAASANPLDNRARRRVMPTPRVLGWDGAGIVEAVGPEVTQFAPGEHVFYSGDLTRPGSFSEFQLVDERLLGKMGRLDFAAAAALPLSALTAWEALFERMRIVPLAAGKSILIIGASGGVGSMAVQLAGKVAGMTVIATASRPASIAWVREMGAAHVIDHRGDLQAQLLAAGFAQVDYVLIVSGTDQHFNAAADVLAPFGTIGLIEEASAALDMGRLWDKSATVVWEMVYTCMDQHGAILTQVAQLVEQGVVATTVSRCLSPINASKVEAALADLRAGGVQGKIVLSGF